MAIAKINLTGTHIQHGFLKVRVDIYPTSTDKTYALHYVDKPDRPYTDEELEDKALRDLVPTHKELNPCLCHFIKVDANTARSALEAEIRGAFDEATFRQLDDVLSEIDKPENRLKLRQLMRPKSGRGKVVPYSTDAKKLVKKVNTRFKDLEVEVGCD